jgi:hypothetical protein
MTASDVHPPDPAPNPAPVPSQADLELAGAMGFYDRSAGRAKLWYQGLRVMTLVLAASIPVVAALDGSTIITAILGSSIVVIEGLQQLFQFHERWVGYRKTWNILDHERRMYEGGAGPYDGAANPGKLLNERMTNILSSENTDWVASASSSESTDA